MTRAPRMQVTIGDSVNLQNSDPDSHQSQPGILKLKTRAQSPASISSKRCHDSSYRCSVFSTQALPCTIFGRQQVQLPRRYLAVKQTLTKLGFCCEGMLCAGTIPSTLTHPVIWSLFYKISRETELGNMPCSHTFIMMHKHMWSLPQH